MDYSLPSFSVHGIRQTRVLKWVAISFSREFSQPRDWTRVSALQAATREASEPSGKPQGCGDGIELGTLPCSSCLSLWDSLRDYVGASIVQTDEGPAGPGSAPHSKPEFEEGSLSHARGSRAGSARSGLGGPHALCNSATRWTRAAAASDARPWAAFSTWQNWSEPVVRATMCPECGLICKFKSTESSFY